jgi:hypothetical protein
MKTKRFFLFGLPAVLLALGLVLAGCDTGSSSDDDDPPPPGDDGVAKSVTITGINADGLITGPDAVGVWLIAEIPTDGMPTPVALEYEAVSEGTLSADLTVPNGMNASNTKWTGTGSYYVLLVPVTYAGGGNLDFNNGYAYVGDGNAPAKAAFNEAAVTLAFTKFVALSTLGF